MQGTLHIRTLTHTGEMATVTEPGSGHTRFEPGKFAINSQQFLMSRPLPVWAQHETVANHGNGLTCLVPMGDVAGNSSTDGRGLSRACVDATIRFLGRSWCLFLMRPP